MLIRLRSLFWTLAFLFLAPMGHAQTVSWLNSSWQYRSAVTIANAGGTALTGYQLNVVLGSGFDFTKVQSNGGDIRFTASDGVTLLPYWIESWNAGSSSASLWVKVPSIPAAGATVYLYYGNSSATSAANGFNTFDFFDDFSSGSIDTTKWTVGGGSWTVVTDTLPNGLSGSVLQGTTNIPNNELLYSSSYTGTDYILEASGKLISGREWGLGARLNGPTNLYSSNLYADLDTTNNLYVYKWLNNNGSNWATQLGSVAVGTVNLNTWYKVSMAVHSSLIDVSVNGVAWEHTSDAQFSSGGVAIFGGENMVAHFSSVRSRKYAATVPTTTIGAVTTNGVSVASVTVNPTVVVGGTSSQGTVTLSGPAPTGGATVTLTSSNTAAAQVPASVVVAAAASTATFTITTSAVSSSTSSTISASYNGSTQTASLGVTAQTVSWLNSSWQYRSAVTIANAGGTALTGYQLNVVLGSGFDFTKAQSNGGDIRFTASDGVTLLPYWIESWNAGSSSASLWVKVPSIPAAGATVYLYYGNSSATSAANGFNTFDFFDDFSSGSIDTTKWTVGGGSWTVVTDTLPNGLSGSVLQGTTNIPNNELLYSFELYGDGLHPRSVRETDQRAGVGVGSAAEWADEPVFEQFVCRSGYHQQSVCLQMAEQQREQLGDAVGFGGSGHGEFKHLVQGIDGGAFVVDRRIGERCGLGAYVGCAVFVGRSSDLWRGKHGCALQLCAKPQVCRDSADDDDRCGNHERSIGGVGDGESDGCGRRHEFARDGDAERASAGRGSDGYVDE